MESVTSKILAMLFLGGISIILGFIPLRMGKWFKESDRSPRHGIIFSSLLCFGGGVLLATSFLHILPDARKNFERAGTAMLINENIPLAELLLMLGFFFIYFIEEFVHCVCDAELHAKHDVEEVCIRRRRKLSVDVHRTFGVHSLSYDHINPITKISGKEDKLLLLTSLRSNVAIESGCDAAAADESLRPMSEFRCNPMMQIPSNFNVHSSLTSYQMFEIKEETPFLKTDNDNGANHLSHTENSIPIENRRKSALRDFFTVLALSFHALFEGLAIGLGPDSANIWILFAAIAIHKYVISFCVGLELCNAKTPRKLYVAYMLVYALMSPTGVVLGIAISTLVEANTTTYLVVVGVLQAIAGGTILYVVVFEVFQREKDKETVPGMAQLTSIILGFSMLMIVEYISSAHE